MRTPRLLLLALALATPAVAAESEYTQSLESVLTMRVDGEVEVDANGRVASHTLETQLPAEIRAPIERAIAAWKFAPPTQDGKPVDRARSKMRIAVVANEVGKNYVMKIENVTFPSPPAAPAAAPIPGSVTIAKRRLPELKVAAEALVTLNLQIDDTTGRVLDVAPSQCTVLAVGRGTTPANACRSLERSSVAAIRTWQMHVVPGADPEPITGTLALRFTWSRSGVKDQAPGQWRSEQRSPYRGAPWLKPDAPRLGTADVSDSSGGLVQQPTGGLTLLEGIGKTL